MEIEPTAVLTLLDTGIGLAVLFYAFRSCSVALHKRIEFMESELRNANQILTSLLHEREGE